MDPWYKIVTPRKEVREGRSFNPDEFAIALEQVVAGNAPEDYRNPEKFFARTCFTRALTEHAGMVLRRLAGETANTAPVLTLITQFGGGKTHTLTALYHLAKHGSKAEAYSGIPALLKSTGLGTVPPAKVAVFVGNAWDPQEGRETPWIDLAYQLAKEKGVEALGPAARKTPPGTEALMRLFGVAGDSVLVLCDEVLNFVNRHRALAEPFHAFLQNLTVAMTGTERSAAVISLPRSQVEMTPFDSEWQERITKVVRRVAKDLISNDEAEISEVIRRRLFEDLGSERIRKRVAKEFADWCFAHRAELPSEWTAVDTATTETKARAYLEYRFEACYPFHPATLSVFQRKWQSLPQYQQTRGTLAMLAQWIAWAQKDGFQKARTEPLITLGSAPLDIPEFRGVVLGQLGESRLIAALDADITGANCHARALDADTKGPLRDIHRRVGIAILFESSGGQTDKSAHLPELRFALGEPNSDTTSVDTVAMALESRSYYLRKVGTDGFRIGYQPTLKKVVNDRRASLDEEAEIIPELLKIIREEFERGRTIPWIAFPVDGGEIQDSPKLTLVVADPALDWRGNGGLRAKVADWTKQRGSSPRLYPGSLVWCFKKPGKELRDKIESMLAWKRVKREIDDGTLGGDFDRSDRVELMTKVKDAEDTARDEVWASYRFVVLADSQQSDGLKAIDLGAGHSSTGETLCGRVITTLKNEALLNESVGSGYIDRNWPPALKSSGAWPLASLRQSFLNGALTRLIDPDATLKGKICEFVERGDFGLASGEKPDGSYERVWLEEMIGPEEVAFEKGVFLLQKSRAKTLKAGAAMPEPGAPASVPKPEPIPEPGPGPSPGSETLVVRVKGTIPPELWNRLGAKVLPKLRAGTNLKVGVEFSVTVEASASANVIADLNLILTELGVAESVIVERE